MGLLSRVNAYAGNEEVSKKLRYASLSLLFIPVGQVLIQAFGLWLGDYSVASLLAAAVVTVPGFFANKYFVWRDTSRDNLYRQVLVFWVTLLIGVSLATLITYLVENAIADQTIMIRASAVVLAQLLGYGIVFVGRFLVLDRWLFKVGAEMLHHVDAVTHES